MFSEHQDFHTWAAMSTRFGSLRPRPSPSFRKSSKLPEKIRKKKYSQDIRFLFSWAATSLQASHCANVASVLGFLPRMLHLSEMFVRYCCGNWKSVFPSQMHPAQQSQCEINFICYTANWETYSTSYADRSIDIYIMQQYLGACMYAMMTLLKQPLPLLMYSVTI